MLLRTAIIGLIISAAGAHSARALQDPAAGAYLDEAARETVRLGRVHRNTVDRSIRRYTAIVQERFSAGLRAGGLERLLFRREVAARIDWRSEGPVRLEVLGAREAIPIAIRGVQIPSGLEDYVPHVAFDPIDRDVFIQLDTTFLRHPLADDAESHYRFRSGDTTTIRLPEGRDIRLIELIVTPRRDDAHLLSGSFWFDADSHGIVRAVFRPARPWDAARDEPDDERPPGFLQPMRAEFSYITIEYGLWELRWWLPRLIAAEGIFQVSRLGVPLSYERRYADYTVEGDTTLAALPADSLPPRPCTAPFRMDVQIRMGDVDSTDTARADSLRRARIARRDSLRAARRAENPELAAEDECLESFNVVIPADSLLLDSEYLPPSLWEGEAAFMSEAELEELGRIVDRLPEAPWQARPPTFAWGLGGGIARYNRIEALSIGAATTLDLGRIALSAEARIGTADLEPNGEIAATRETPGGVRRLTAYRRLAAANPETRPLGIGNSLNAFLIGRDDGQYFRTIGAELTFTPSPAGSQWYDLRLYGEHQKTASVETDFSLRHLLDDGYAFRPNIVAAPADQFGASLTLRTSHGLDPASFRWGAEAGATGEIGSFHFLKPWALLRGALPFGGTILSAEIAAGTSTGNVPSQSRWYLGGPGTLRGQPGGTVNGEAFWRTRTELSRGVPAARLALFADVGWAGPRNGFGTRDALSSAGVGLTFLDGLIRLDLARAIEPSTGWRFDMHVSRSY